jgi:hypothetical protein
MAVMETAAGLPTLEVRLISETHGWNYIRHLRGETNSTGVNGNGN